MAEGHRDPHAVILGGGPAGLGAAFALRRERRARATVLEQRDRVGGNAGSFDLLGQTVDYGSHRLHPACHPEILGDIKALLGPQLARRPRHGRIRLRGRWIHFPLKPMDLALRLDPGFAIGTLRDTLGRVLPRRRVPEDTFADVLRSRLGHTICEHFYFPYARKIWGLEPEDLSATQAHKRVAANSPGKLLRKIFGKVPGVRSVGFSYYYYPAGGYGAISDAYATEATRLGADIRLGTRVTELEREAHDGTWRVRAIAGDEHVELESEAVWSTIPITLLVQLIRPSPPAAVLEAADRIRYRSMLLVYLALKAERFTEFDAHYFPDEETRITRLSEPKNYAGTENPRDRTILCAEIPCSVGDDWWESDTDQLGERVASDLESVGLGIPGQIESVHTRRLRFAYPIYGVGYEGHFRTLDTWVQAQPCLLSFGRQGLFAHDNTHHALYMAYAAAQCLDRGGFDSTRWEAHRAEFETHVVED